ncbi:MAG: PEP-CTERM sorting domain-containing protein [Nitrospirae bacterium]|nr:MAG: PEP-CTERM sorting domain-containing protein [Nitrospirota bacterium]
MLTSKTSWFVPALLAAVGAWTLTAWGEGVEYASASLLVDSYQTNSVLEYNSTTGAFIQAFVPSGSGGLNVTGDPVFGPNGNLFVGSQGTNSILEYNGTTGAFVGTFVSPGSGGLIDPRIFVFGPNGNLFVHSGGTNSILEYNGTTGAFVTTFVASGSGGLSIAQEPVFGPNGNLFVGSGGTGSVLEYNGTTGAFITAFVPSLPLYNGVVGSPHGLAFGPNGNLFVGDFLGTNNPINGVLEYNRTTGAFIGQFVQNMSGGLNEPTYLLFTPTTPAVPEPSSLLLLGSGLAGLAWWRRKFAA